MKFYDEQLQKLQEQIARKRQLEAQVSELRTQRSTLSTRVRELEAIKMQEQADVDKLEGRSLAAFFYNVIGKMDEQLNKEREEAYAARVKYDAAARELTAVEIFGSLFPGERISKSMDYLSELEVFSGKCTSICGYGMEMPLASNAFLTLSSRR